MNWYNANKHCKSKGGKLVEIDSKEENTVLVKEINRREYTGKNFWIGLTDQGSGGNWWLASSGLKPSYLNWHGGEPNGRGNQNCARIRIGPYADWKDTWSDIGCAMTFVTNKIPLSSYTYMNGQKVFKTRNHKTTMHALCEFSQPTELPTAEGRLKQMI